jgi:Ca2+-binding EF-hand superfamily protein
MRKITMAAAIASGLLGAAVAQAGCGVESAAAAQEKWTQADTDRNGTLSQAELSASMPTLSSSFTTIDANGDGQISNDELANFKAQHGQRELRQSFAAADTNRDGSLDLSEAQAGMPTLASSFTTVDANADGKVSIDELKAHHKAMPKSSMEADERSQSSTTSTTTSTTTTDTDTDKDTEKTDKAPDYK